MKLSSREVKRMNAEKARIIIPLRKILGEQWETLNTYVTKLFEMATNREVRSAGNNTIAENNRLWKENDELKANVQRQDESLTQMAVEVDKALKTQRAAVEKGSAELAEELKRLTDARIAELDEALKDIRSNEVIVKQVVYTPGVRKLFDPGGIVMAAVQCVWNAATDPEYRSGQTMASNDILEMYPEKKEDGWIVYTITTREIGNIALKMECGKLFRKIYNE